jgi:hypothetical protein
MEQTHTASIQFSKFTSRGRVDNITVSYSGGPPFKSRPGDWLSWQIASDFPQSLQANVGIEP